MFFVRNNIASNILSCAFALSALTLLSQPAEGRGRFEDIVLYKNVQYDGACLYNLATRYAGLSDAEYEPKMEECLWNGVENPPSPGIPIATTFNCMSSIPCVRVFGRFG